MPQELSTHREVEWSSRIWSRHRYMYTLESKSHITKVTVSFCFWHGYRSVYGVPLGQGWPQNYTEGQENPELVLPGFRTCLTIFCARFPLFRLTLGWHLQTWQGYPWVRLDLRIPTVPIILVLWICRTCYKSCNIPQCWKIRCQLAHPSSEFYFYSSKHAHASCTVFTLCSDFPLSSSHYSCMVKFDVKKFALVAGIWVNTVLNGDIYFDILRPLSWV